MTDQTIAWLRNLEKKGGKGVVNNIDARCLGRIADDLERLRAALEPFAAVKLPSNRKSEIDYDRSGLRRCISPMEIACRKALHALGRVGGTLS